MRRVITIAAAYVYHAGVDGIMSDEEFRSMKSMYAKAVSQGYPEDFNQFFCDCASFDITRHVLKVAEFLVTDDVSDSTAN
ncbi:MAG: hypothetical protein PHV18_14195 [Lachnospiraceae bacterium]|nr:hypothetical protein [Lachnospiraceae bacterium]